MAPDHAQKTWAEFHERKKASRMAEAAKLWALLQKAGAADDTVLALDFLHFGTLQSGAENLAKQLSENYEVSVLRSDEDDVWYVKGTTRPYGITLTSEQHADWVEFMYDAARSHGCVFANWSLEAPALGVHVHSEHIDSDS